MLVLGNNNRVVAIFSINQPSWNTNVSRILFDYNEIGSKLGAMPDKQVYLRNVRLLNRHKLDVNIHF